MAICIVCKGTKQLEVGLADFQTPENSHMEEIKCFWCEGEGEMTEVQRKALDQYRADHCSCMVPRNPYMCMSSINLRTKRPNFHCSRCGKIILESEVILNGRSKG